ncbi:hypothetical protein WNY37_18540 [Henriciella sp. AS95]|uniref:hypothetical protein n=1 Tax=Henriciella sp. AS95 TaxID=3135782 RepID=UPI0031820108
MRFVGPFNPVFLAKDAVIWKMLVQVAPNQRFHALVCLGRGAGIILEFGAKLEVKITHRGLGAKSAIAADCSNGSPQTPTLLIEHVGIILESRTFSVGLNAFSQNTLFPY